MHMQWTTHQKWTWFKDRVSTVMDCLTTEQQNQLVSIFEKYDIDIVYKAPELHERFRLDYIDRVYKFFTYVVDNGTLTKDKHARLDAVLLQPVPWQAL